MSVVALNMAKRFALSAPQSPNGWLEVLMTRHRPISKKRMPANILNLPDYAVLAVEHDDHDDHDDHLCVEVRQPPTHCPNCNSDRLVGFGRREPLVKDLPMHGKRVGMYINTRRMQCRACVKTFSETLPKVNEKRAMTMRRADWIGKTEDHDQWFA
ncbi:transposase family protein [Mycetohabitans rhizoxinica]|uniref:transposase family protein n=1 Tax=Mycetohabitans rhizoxinica TaxID=412963 RepID=UPI0030CE90FD